MRRSITFLIALALACAAVFVGCGDSVPTATDQNQIANPNANDRSALNAPDVWVWMLGDSTGEIAMIEPPTQPPPPPQDSSTVKPTTIGKVKQEYLPD